MDLYNREDYLQVDNEVEEPQAEELAEELVVLVVLLYMFIIVNLEQEVNQWMEAHLELEELAELELTKQEMTVLMAMLDKLELFIT